MAVEPVDGLLRVSTVLERDEAQAQARAALGPFPRDDALPQRPEPLEEPADRSSRSLRLDGTLFTRTKRRREESAAACRPGLHCSLQAPVLKRPCMRAWAHVTALNLSVRDCARRGRGARFRALATGALLRFPTPGIPSVSVEINRSVYTADEWYRQAMERAVGSVRVASPPALNGLELPPCARAGALAVRSPRTVLTLPDLAADLPSFGRLAELSLSLVQLGGARPLGEFLASCCPRLRTLRLCSVRGPALRRLALRTDALEVLDVSNVDDLTLTSLDVAATNLRCLSVRSCFRSPTGGGGEVAVSAPRIEAVRWYRSYPEQLIFRSDLASARRLGGPLRLPARPVGRRSHPAAPARLLPRPPPRPGARDAGRDESSPQLARTSREDLIRRVPQLPNVSALSLKIRWGFGGGIAPSLASLLSRTPGLTRLRMDTSPYCFAVFGEDPEECRVLEVLLGSAARSLERVSLTFGDDAAASIFDEIATDIPARFPVAAAGRWERCPPSVLTWIKRPGR
ncbi:hypothetical protein C2845_PM04G21690 [Panicum miliaceum]|uniref:Uncharacterized protein n=1 Tax=Panicum miliaceum TaxID=4540 RepID=A0A3L6QQY9_PANMI|nr:hypothetical protein C2845_PM04G21690 [Panicum miliaceum]